MLKIILFQHDTYTEIKLYDQLENVKILNKQSAPDILWPIKQ